MMTEENKVRGSIITTVVEPLWAFGAHRIQQKLSPGDHVWWAASLATRWQALLVDLVDNALQDWHAMMAMGIHDSAMSEDDLVDQDHICSLVFDMLIALVVAKGASLAVTHLSPPHCFAGMLPSCDSQESFIGSALREWQTVLAAELRATVLPSWRTFMGSIHFLRWPVAIS